MKSVRRKMAKVGAAKLKKKKKSASELDCQRISLARIMTRCIMSRVPRHQCENASLTLTTAPDSPEMQVPVLPTRTDEVSLWLLQNSGTFCYTSNKLNKNFISNELQVTTAQEAGIQHENDWGPDTNSFPNLIVERENTENGTFKIFGRRIVNIAYVMKEMEIIGKHPLYCTMGGYKLQLEIINGVACSWHYFCDNCERKFIVISEPPYTSEDVWEKHTDAAMKQAAEQEKQIALKKGNIMNSIPFITVIGDDGWSQRSYGHSFRAKSGAVIIGLETMKLLHMEVKNQFSSTFTQATSRGVSPAAHKCYQNNYKGASTGMESQAILDRFSQSVDKYGLLYRYSIGDDDSTVHTRLVESGHRYVIKLECVNHMVRSLSDKLHKLAKDTIIPLESRRLLTEQHVTSEGSKYDKTSGMHHIMFPVGTQTAEVTFVLAREKQTTQMMRKAIDPPVKKGDSLKFNYTKNQARINYTKRGSYRRRCLAAAQSHLKGPALHFSLSKKLTGHMNYGVQDAPPDIDDSEMKRKSDELISSLTEEVNTPEKRTNLERQTARQHQKQLWQFARMNRHTASKFGQVVNRKKHHYIVKNIVYSEELYSEAVVYGRMNEEKAVQGQLNIDEKTFCDFVVYSPRDFFVERIVRDVALWEERMLPLLLRFYFDSMVSEILDGRIPRKLRTREPECILEARENDILTSRNGWVTLGIVPDDAADRRVFSGSPVFPALRSGIVLLLRT
ncbi:hypothetical protein PR048_023604 [Dryococelus australis]|uniref:Mutator-like transposase domain-containing protein n=1 Tax=Dryococelus australis TaxID=614101 RepID=A0ABQ9GUK4_9NEOP|nr:hypothetical protein PR048_023604 [Dryococelus australis]